jgi:hypothetical protein
MTDKLKRGDVVKVYTIRHSKDGDYRTGIILEEKLNEIGLSNMLYYLVLVGTQKVLCYNTAASITELTISSRMPSLRSKL